jgi:subtilisin family serine protease
MAAGNEANTNPYYPAFYPEAFSVAATDANDLLAGFSGHGPWIDMSAPGASVRSLEVGNTTGWVSGTSFSAPHVAGAAALMRAVSPSLTNSHVRQLLILTSDDLGAPGFDPDYGWGRLDIGQAVFWASRTHNIR